MGLDITGLGSFADLASKIIDKIFPDKDEANKVKLEMIRLQQEGNFKELELEYANALEQVKVNVEEAKNPNLFVSGWRPAVGWVCVCGLLYSVFLRPMISWLATIWGLIAVPPPIDNVLLLNLVLGMLGMGALRTIERVKGKI